MTFSYPAALVSVIVGGIMAWIAYTVLFVIYAPCSLLPWYH